MEHLEKIVRANHNAQELEALYQTAMQTGQAANFRAAIESHYAETPDNLLYAAWHYRLAAPAQGQPSDHNTNWRLAIPLSVACGLILWLLSDDKRFVVHKMPLLGLLAAPISACFVMAFLSLTAHLYPRRLLLLGLGLFGFVVYVIQAVGLLDTSTWQNDYLVIAALHVALFAWVAVGVYLLWSNPAPDERFAFLLKSIEVSVTGGLFGAAGAVFTAVAFGLFQALEIKLPELVMRLFLAGGAGLLPVLAVATVYRPEASPLAQSFGQGLGKLIVTVNRLLLPLTLVVLVVYILFIPFNFMQPFHNRDLLMVYNGMLFGIMALIVGAVPVHDNDLSPQLSSFLRRALLVVAGLAALVSVYALAAILYRTWQGGFTPNRLTVIGWNGVNTVLLLILLAQQGQVEPENWRAALRKTVSLGTILYTGWAVLVVLALPWLF